MTESGPAAGPGRKPEWLKKRIPSRGAVQKTESILRRGHLHTVCESALCPNLGECFARGTATFLIMGDLCTRNCRFCHVTTGRPEALDPQEPQRVAEAVAQLGLRHVVVTSVTRDDLPDGGAEHYAETIRAIRAASPAVTVEVLVPDFQGATDDIDTVLSEAPEVFNHNVETVPRLYPVVRPQAVYKRSLEVLRRAVDNGLVLTKTGLMVGLGETPDEVRALLGEVGRLGVQIVTIGQYLAPSREHLPVKEYVHPDVFAAYATYGEGLGLQVHSSPFVRSSFQAEEAYAEATTAQGRTTCS